MAPQRKPLPALTLEYVLSICGCWSEERVRERAKLWPEPLTWTWLLGPRTEEYSRDDVRMIFDLAIAHITSQRIPRDVLGMRRAGELRQSVQSLEGDKLHRFIADVGRRLDRYAAELELAAAARNGLELAEAPTEPTESNHVNE
jgi:hypothetical protein